MNILGRNSLAWRILHHRTAFAGLTICMVVLLAVIFGPMIIPYGAEDMDFMATLAPPSLNHPFGTDSFGRDLFSRVLYGGRTALLIGVSASFIGCTVGAFIGIASAYWRGSWFDQGVLSSAMLTASIPSF